MATRYFDSGTGRETVTIEDFVKDCFGAGDPFGPVEDGDIVEYTVEPDGKVQIFIYNTIYEFLPEEFEQMKTQMPKIQFQLENPEPEFAPRGEHPVEQQAKQLVKNVLERVKLPEVKGEVPTWQVSLEAPRQVAGFKISIEGFTSGADKEAARAAMIKEIDYMLDNSANWTPWNAAAKAEEDEGGYHTIRSTGGKRVKVFIPGGRR
jgi:hypothetical protein